MSIKLFLRALPISVIVFSICFMSCLETEIKTEVEMDVEKPAVGIGDKIPGFRANDDMGNVWKLEDNLGSAYLIVYFYPAAMTGGCTLQACSYRDNSAELKDLDVAVVGVSGDSVNNLKIFREAHDLNFGLLSDVDGEIAALFGVPVKEGGSITRSVAGKDVSMVRSYTTSRWTFVLDSKGTIVYKDTEVHAENDSKDVIEFLQTL
ncbi:peroxiredoxin [Candidatus Latescibacterota bacterium]